MHSIENKIYKKYFRKALYYVFFKIFFGDLIKFLYLDFIFLAYDIRNWEEVSYMYFMIQNLSIISDGGHSDKDIFNKLSFTLVINHYMWSLAKDSTIQFYSGRQLSGKFDFHFVVVSSKMYVILWLININISKISPMII